MNLLRKILYKLGLVKLVILHHHVGDEDLRVLHRFPSGKPFVYYNGYRLPLLKSGDVRGWAKTWELYDPVRALREVNKI